MIESLNKGADGMIHSANIQTTSGKTNRPIARLYPLEVNSSDMDVIAPETDSDSSNSMTTSADRPTREAAKRSQQKIKKWVDLLCAPRRMS